MQYHSKGKPKSLPSIHFNMLKTAIKKDIVTLGKRIDNSNGKVVDVLYIPIHNGDGAIMVPIAQMLQGNPYGKFTPPSNIQTNVVPTDEQRRQLAELYVNEMIKGVFLHSLETELPTLKNLKKRERAIVKHIKKKIAELQNSITDLVHSILSDEAKRELRRRTAKPSKYPNTEEGFKAFQDSVKILSVVDYLKSLDVDPYDQLPLFEGIEHVRIYETYEIFKIKENDSWEYDSFRATKCRYATFKDGEDITEDNDLVKVERAVFKTYQKDHSTN